MSPLLLPSASDSESPRGGALPLGKALVNAATKTGWDKADEPAVSSTCSNRKFIEQFPDMEHKALQKKWTADAAFMEVYAQLSAGADPDEERPALIAALEPLVTAPEGMTAHDVAETIAQSLPELVLYAKQGTDQVLLEVQRGRNDTQTAHAEILARLDQLAPSQVRPR